MARIFYWGTILLALAGLLVSWVIFPGDDELAFLQYKDQQYSKALVLYELQVSKGNHTPQVIIPLIDLYLKNGQIDQVVELMEAFTEQHPDNIEARRQLGVYYQYAQRQDDYRRNLEILYQLAPSPEILRRLSDIYSFNGNIDRQVAILEELVNRHTPVEKDYTDLAYLYAARGEYDSAIATLEQLLTRSPSTVQPGTVEFLINLLLDTGRVDDAFDRARQYAGTGRKDEASRYANRFYVRGATEQAYQLLRPYLDTVDQDPELLMTVVFLENDLGRQSEAYARLLDHFERGSLPVALEPLFLDFLLENNEIRLLPTFLAKTSPSMLRPDQRLRLIDTAIQSGDNRLIRQLLTSFGPDIRTAYPVFDVRLTLMVDRSSIPRKAEAVRRLNGLTDTQRLQLALIYAAEGFRAEARAILADVKTLDHTDTISRFDIAELYLTFDLAPHGYRLFEQQLSGSVDKPTDEVRRLENLTMMLAAATGDDETVIRFLTTVDATDPQTLMDLYFLAQDSGKTVIMLETSRQLVLNQTDDRYSTFRVEALLAAQRYHEALPYLKRLAETEGQSWIYRYAETLEKTGDTTTWRDLWQQQATRPDIEPAEKRSIAYALLEKGFSPAALTVFYQLAQNQPPDHPDVDRLLDIWETDRNPAALDWLADRIAAADPSDKHRWFERYYRSALLLGEERRFEPLLMEHPDLLETLTKLEDEAGRQEAAYQRLALLYQVGRLPVGLFPALADHAIARDDEAVLNRLVLDDAIRELDNDVLLSLYSQALPALSIQTVQTLYNRLGNDFFQDRPHLDLMFAAAQARPIDPETAITMARELTLPPEQKLMVAEYLFETELKDAAEAIFISVLDLSHLGEDELIRVAYRYLALGKPQTGLERFERQRALLADRDTVANDTLNHVHLLLATAAGQPAIVQRYLDTKPVDAQRLKDIYYVAMDYGQTTLAIRTAEQLHRVTPGLETLSLKARAWLAGERYREALPALRELVAAVPDEWTFTYLETLEKLDLTDEWRAYWMTQAQQPSIDNEQLTVIAFMLLEKGQRQSAEALFLKQAARFGPDSRYLEQLLFLWGMRPGPDAIRWLEKRLETAPIEEKAGWLRVFRTIGQDDRVVTYIQNHRHPGTTEMADLLLDILIERKDRAAFTREATIEIERERRVDRLKKLARSALQLELEALAATAYAKAYRFAPNDREVLNEYGKIAFYQGDEATAETLLGKFINNGGLDHLSTYLYAELLWRRQATAEARRYYRQAAELTGMLIRRDLNDELLLARIQHRLGRTDDALRRYRELHRQYPDNETLKAELVELLLETNRLEEAETLLNTP
jgi:tetratricopeptide (TPR) repeat protein